MTDGSQLALASRPRLLSKLELIRRVPLFAQLTAAQAEVIAESVVVRRFMRWETVVQQGDQTDKLFVLLSGDARVIASTSRGREVFLAKLGPGDFFGEMSLIDNGPHAASVRLERNADVLVLGRDDFARCLAKSPSLAYALMRGLVRRLRGANKQITSLALMDVAGRVARTLLEWSEMADGVRLIKHRVSRSDLAKHVGASREMVSRVMRELKAQGLIFIRDDGSLVLQDKSTKVDVTG